MSSLNLNKVVLCGRLTADAELKQTQSGVAVTTFTLAVNRRYQPKNEDGSPAQQQADFINVVAWRQTAEFITRYFRKGSSLCITGAIQTRSWKDNNGNTRYATEVIAEEAMFVDSKSDNGAAPTAQESAVPPAIDTVTAPNFEPLNDEPLPF